MAEKVLVTGGFGLVGSQTVRRLVDDGHCVVATDLGSPAQRKAAASLPANAEARWADLTDPSARSTGSSPKCRRRRSSTWPR